MNHFQRRSILAIITMVEGALQQLKSIVALEAEVSGKTTKVDSPMGNSEYLSNDEEDAIERMLEEDRRYMASEQDRKVHALWGSDEN